MTKPAESVLFIGINSSYIHTNPAIRTLAKITGSKWAEFNINQQKDFVLRELYCASPAVAAFSCYIWNIEYVLEVAENLKKILYDTKILLGGPEVSYDTRSLMGNYPFIDGAICGEGEEVISSAISSLYGAELPAGVFVRRNGEVIGFPKYNTVKNIDEIGNPFENCDYDPNKIFYYESSRGCPYSCAYCLSGDKVKVRHKTLDTTKKELDLIAEKNVRLIKFVDRTFNADRERAYRILKYIIENEKFQNCRFHFEIGLDLLNGETLSLLTRESAERVQFEAGIQTCNERTLNLVSRRTNIEKALENARFLTQNTKVELHLDLIAGLPGEDFNSFKNSFNRVYSIYAHSLQLGFLKVLKGTRLRKDAEKYGIVYRSKPPYETLRTDDISPKELYILKGISELVNRYYNTGRARLGLDYITRNLQYDPFEFYKGLYEYAYECEWEKRPLSAPDQFRMLMDYAQTVLSESANKNFLKQLKKDYKAVKIKGAMPRRLASI